jgi:hypothetical protein
MDPHVEVIHPDGTAESFRLSGERVVLGRSPTAGIPLLDARDLEPEHLLLDPRADGCFVAQSRSAAAPLVSGGNPLTAGVVPWGTELAVGSLRLLLHRTAPRSDRGTLRSRLLLGAAALAVGLWAWPVLFPGRVQIQEEAGVPAPPLFDPAPDACPVRGVDRAQVRAEDRLQAADAKRERYPFEAQDGVDGVRLYGEAAACFRAGEDPARAEAAERTAAALALHIEEDYRAHRLRLERALELERYDDALFEVQSLRALLEHRDDPYTGWLAIVERQLLLALEPEEED